MSEQTNAAPFPERDTTKPVEQQGLFRKFDVRRTDGSDRPGGKHYGCRYFVLDMTHDQHAPAALRAYAASCEVTHPALAADLIAEFGAAPAAAPAYADLLRQIDEFPELNMNNYTEDQVRDLNYWGVRVALAAQEIASQPAQASMSTAETAMLTKLQDTLGLGADSGLQPTLAMAYLRIQRLTEEASQPAQGEREQFEAWFRKRNKVPDWFNLVIEGTPAEGMWEAWQAASQPAQGEPVAWMKRGTLGAQLRNSLLSIATGDRRHWVPLYATPPETWKVLPSQAPSDARLLEAFNRGECVIDGLHEVVALIGGSK